MNAYTLHTYKSHHEIQGQVKATLLYEDKNINQLNLKIEDPELFHVKYLGKCIFHAPRNPIDCSEAPWHKKLRSQRIPSSSLLFTRTVILSTVHGVTATMEDPTVHIKAKILHIFLSLFPYLILPKPKEIPRNRNTKKKPKTPIYNSTPHNSK